MAQTLIHLVYIHGFQGNDTTFQSFPTDLQQHLSARMLPHLKVQSSLYPTYKSVKPISFATRNFLEWVSTQPKGPVILLGHSMGGLLAADAATDPTQRSRIIGMIAFDTPYLGMHPHVVVSGIASLLPKDDDKDKNGKQKPTEREMNDEEQVNMVHEDVTDDWEVFKKNNAKQHAQSPQSSSTSSSRNSSYHSFPPSPSPSRTPPSQSPSPNSTSFIDRTISFFSAHAEDPLVRWARKHSNDPFSAGKRWIVERFQFGICMFDPSGLRERYARLVAWDGRWVNYWTITPARQRGEGKGEQDSRELDNDVALLESGITLDGSEAASQTNGEESSLESPTFGPRTKSEDKSVRKAEQKAVKVREKEVRKAEKANAKSQAGRHFIVLPTGLGRVLGGLERWEQVCIGGVTDEVAAHCGLFVRGQNLEYDELVERVGRRVLDWCAAV